MYDNSMTGDLGEFKLVADVLDGDKTGSFRPELEPQTGHMLVDGARVDFGGLVISPDRFQKLVA